MNVKGGGSLLEETSLEVVGVKLCVYEKRYRETDRKKRRGFLMTRGVAEMSGEQLQLCRKGYPVRYYSL